MKQAKTTGKKLGALLLSACILMSMPGMAPAAGAQTPQTVRAETEQGDLHQPEAQAAAEDAVSAEPENNPNSAEGESRPGAESPAAPADPDETNTTGEPNETDKNSVDKPKSRPAGLSKEPAEVLTEQEEPSVPIKVEPDEPLYLPEGKAVTDADLLAGVTAADKNGDPVEITVQDVDSLDMENPKMRGMAEPYTITYAAVHPVSDEVFTVTRKAYVTVGVMPVAAAGDFTITKTGGGDPTYGTDYDYSGNVLTIKSSTPMTISGTTTTGAIVVAGGITANITLDGVNIDVSARHSACAFNITGNSTANITLQGTNILKSGSNCAGLYVSAGNTIKIDGSGSLRAQGHDFSAGIGSAGFTGCGTIIINGGIVNANGGFKGAGIGGGNNGFSGGTITINGGTVTATGTYDAKDIGPGDGGSDGTITITGGSVDPTRGRVSPRPTNGTDPVYLNTLTVGNPSVGDGKGIQDVVYDTSIGYGSGDVVTADGGKLYVWLPQNSSAPGATVWLLTEDNEVYLREWARTGTTETQTLLKPGNADTPALIGHPLGGIHHKGSAWSIGVFAQVVDGGTLSYQWYSNTTNNNTNGSFIQGATSASYYPDTSAVGTTYYYCIVTNTNLSLAGTQTATATSNVAAVKLIDEPDVAAVAAPTAVFVGDQLALTAPAVTDNGDTVTDEGWEISADGNTGWTTFDLTTTNMTYAHNGQYLRYYATNSVGTSYSSAVQITVNKLDLTLSLSCADIIYGQAPSPQLSGNLGNGTVTYDYKVQGAPNTDYSTTVPTEAGDYTVRASVAATDIYNTAEAEADFRIEKAVPGISLTASPAAGAYADDSVALTAALTGIDPGDYPTGNVVFKNGSATLGTGTLVNGEAVFVWQNVPFGTHALTAEYAGNNNYESASDSVSGYDIQKKTQDPLAITGIPANPVYGDDSFTLGTTGGSGTGAVTYTVQSGDAVSVSGDTVTLEKAGTAMIKATKEADNVYNETSVTISVTVAKAVPGIQSDPSVIGANVGEMLSALSLTNLTAYGADGSALSGSFAWENPQTVVQAAGKFKAIFTPDDESYETVTCDVQVSLDTARPVITSVKATPSANGAKLEAAAEAGTPLSYQWQVKGSWIDIPGATAAVFDYTGLSADTEYTVRVIVTDANGNSTMSEPVTFKTGAAAVTGLPENYTLSNGKSVSWTPRPAGGTWSYDKEYLSIKREGDTVTFTAQKAGKTTVTYTAGGTQYVVTITITDSSAVQTNNNSTTPQTGDNSHVGLWLALLGIGSAGILGIFVRQKKRKSFR